MFSKTSVGIELTGRDLRLAVIGGSGRKFRLVRTLDLPGFLDLSREDQKTAVATLIKNHKLPANRVFLTIHRDKGTIRQLEFPVEVADKLQSAIALQVEALSPWSAEEIYWDYSQSPVSRNAKTVRATVAIIPRDALDPWIELFMDAGLPLAGACLSSLAHAHGVSMLWPESSPIVALNCEQGFVEGCLVQEGQLSSLTQSGADVTAAARGTVERLMAIGRLPSLGNVRLLVFGPASSAMESHERVALPMDNTAPDTSDRFGSIAAAMLAFRKSGFESNLVPKTLRYRRNHLQWAPTYVLLAFALLLGLGFLVRQPYQLTAYASRIDDEIQRVAPVANEVVAQQAELNQLSEKYRVLAGHFKARDYTLEALRELTRALPASAWISSYAYQDGTVTLSGFADTASEIQKVIEDNPLFKDVQFTSAVTRDAKGKDRFTLKATVEVPQ